MDLPQDDFDDRMILLQDYFDDGGKVIEDWYCDAMVSTTRRFLTVDSSLGNTPLILILWRFTYIDCSFPPSIFEFAFEPPTGLDSVVESPYMPSFDTFAHGPLFLVSGARVFEPPENMLYTLSVI
jgi:hypothetical protein